MSWGRWVSFSGPITIRWYGGIQPMTAAASGRQALSNIAALASKCWWGCRSTCFAPRDRFQRPESQAERLSPFARQLCHPQSSDVMNCSSVSGYVRSWKILPRRSRTINFRKRHAHGHVNPSNPWNFEMSIFCNFCSVSSSSIKHQEHQ